MSSSSSDAPAKKAKATKKEPKAKKAAPRTSYSNENKDGLVLSKYGNWYKPRPRVEAYHEGSSFRAAYKKINPEAQQLIDMVLDPDAVDSATRWPNTYGLSSVYKSVNTINASFDTNKQSLVYVYPRLNNAIFTTAGNAFPQTLTVSGTSAGNFVYQDIAINEDTNQSAFITSPWYWSNNHVALPVPATVAGNVQFLYPITWNSTDTTPVAQFLFTNIGLGDAGQLSMKMRWYDASMGLIQTTSTIVQANGVVSFPLNATATTNVTSYISLEVYLASHPYQGRVLGQLRETGAGPAFMGIVLSNTYTHCIAANVNGSGVVTGSSEEYIVLAQSLLCTHVGSTLQDGGVIATARVPADTAVGEKSEAGSDVAAGGNQHYNWLASLQNNRYDGKVKNGCYSFYLGDDETAYFYRPVQTEITDLPYMVAAFNTTDTAAAVVRIKIVTHIQFKSNSNVFAQLPSPYMKDVRLLPHLLSIVCSSYSNEDHKSSLKDTLKSIGKSVGKTLMSPKTWMTVAELVALLA